MLSSASGAKRVRGGAWRVHVGAGGSNMVSVSDASMGCAWGSPILPARAPLPVTDPEPPPPQVCAPAGLCRLTPQWAWKIWDHRRRPLCLSASETRSPMGLTPHCLLRKLILSRKLATYLSCSLALLPWGCARQQGNPPPPPRRAGASEWVTSPASMSSALGRRRETGTAWVQGRGYLSRSPGSQPGEL